MVLPAGGEKTAATETGPLRVLWLKVGSFEWTGGLGRENATEPVNSLYDLGGGDGRIGQAKVYPRRGLKITAMSGHDDHFLGNRQC